MKFDIIFTHHADEQLEDLEQSKDKKAPCKAVHKILGLMETNLRHPSLNTHGYDDLAGPNGEKVFESYAQNRTPGGISCFLALWAGKKTNYYSGNMSTSLTLLTSTFLYICFKMFNGFFSTFKLQYFGICVRFGIQLDIKIFRHFSYFIPLS